MKKSASNSIFLITLLIISFSSLLFAAQNQTCYPQDQIAINQIQTAFGLTPTPNCCDWEAVTCSDVAPFRVTDLIISNNSTVSGQIPAAIGDLSSLQTLQLVDVPNIAGNIPPAIAKLTNLFLLSFTSTSLSGPIPSFLANLKNLIYLYLDGNALTGSIPPQLSQLPNLSLLSITGNKLITGSIPESFGYFSSNLTYLYLRNNSLRGALPNSLGNLNIHYIDLSQNSFTGDASFLFGKNKITQDLILEKNKFSFNFSNVEFPSNLAALTLDHNLIFGSIPQQITQLNNLDLDYFDVSYNNLCGPIPQDISAAGPDRFAHNKCLCGNPLPPCK